MGSLRDCTWILGLAEYRVIGLERQADGRLVVDLERRGVRRYICSDCGRRTGRVRDAKVRTWDDLPWAEHPVTLRCPLRRLLCRACGIRTERVRFADPHARLTRRFRQRIGLDCQSMPTSHAASRHAVSWGTARRAERAFLDAWDRSRPKRRPKHLGVDEIQRGRGQHFWTVLSDLVRGEVIGLAKDRSEDSLRTFLHERLDARQRAAVEAVCTDMHRPYVNVVSEVLKQTKVVFDKFHVLQHASAALDEVRRQEFFRAGSVMREHGRGKRWLLLRRWKTVRGSKRAGSRTRARFARARWRSRAGPPESPARESRSLPRAAAARRPAAADGNTACGGRRQTLKHRVEGRIHRAIRHRSLGAPTTWTSRPVPTRNLVLLENIDLAALRE